MLRLVERGKVSPKALITQALPLEKAFGVIEQMSTFQNVGISAIPGFERGASTATGFVANHRLEACATVRTSSWCEKPILLTTEFGCVAQASSL